MANHSSHHNDITSVSWRLESLVFRLIVQQLFYVNNKETIKLLVLHEGDRSPATWWRHQIETFSALLAICAGNSPVTGEFPAQRPVMRSFDAFFDPRLIKRLSKQWWGWWFETPSFPYYGVITGSQNMSWMEKENHNEYIRCQLSRICLIKSQWLHRQLFVASFNCMGQ